MLSTIWRQSNYKARSVVRQRHSGDNRKTTKLLKTNDGAHTRSLSQPQLIAPRTIDIKNPDPDYGLQNGRATNVVVVLCRAHISHLTLRTPEPDILDLPSRAFALQEVAIYGTEGGPRRQPEPQRLSHLPALGAHNSSTYLISGHPTGHRQSTSAVQPPVVRDP